MSRKRGGQNVPRGEYEEPFLIDMDADEALERFAGVSTQEAEAVEVLVKSDGTIDGLMKAFEAAAHDDGAAEFWYATDLMRLFEYSRWTKFRPVIEKARTACIAAGQDPNAHFANAAGTGPWDPNGEVMYRAGTNPAGGRPGEDVILSRYAAYLAAENADSSKVPVAFAQTYFATQTRRAELADQAPTVGYDETRLLLRTRLKEHNKSLAQAAKTAGVTNFANFNGAGLKGLYGGLNQAQVLKRKGLPAGANHLDYAGHEELAANYFKATQAEAKLRREIEAKGEIGQKASDAIHKDVGNAVRQTIADLGGTQMEDVAAEDHIKEAQKRVKAAQPKAISAPAAKKAAKPKKT